MENHWGDNQSTQSNSSSYSEPVKIFIQGIPFATISIGFVVFLSLLGLELLFLDLRIFFGVLVGSAISFLVIMGLANSILAKALWNIRPKMSVLGFIGQGLLFVLMVFIFFSFFFIFFLVLSFSLLSNILFILISFALLAPIGGYLGKHIASEFEPTRARKDELASVHDRHVSCSNCSKKFVVAPNETDESGGIICSGCGKWLSVFDRSPSL